MDRLSTALVEVNRALRLDPDAPASDGARLRDEVILTGVPPGVFSDFWLQADTNKPSAWNDGTSLGQAAEHIVPPLEVDDNLEAVEDDELIPHFVEANVTALSQIISSAIGVRSEYTGLAQAYVEFVLRVEELSRMNLALQIENEIGLDRRAHSEAVASYNAFNDIGLSDNIEATALYLTQNMSSWDAVRSSTERSLKLSELSNIAGEASMRIAAAQLSEKEVIVEGRAADTYMELALNRYRKAVARDALASRYEEFLKPGSAINYLPRMNELQLLYREQLKRGLSLASAIRNGCEAIYQFEVDMPDLTLGAAIDGLGKWLLEVSDKLRVRRSLEQTFVRTLWASRSGDNWREKLSQGLELECAAQDPRTQRLRGVAIEFVGSAETPTLEALVVPPKEPPDWPRAIPQPHLNKLRIGRVSSAALTPDVKYEHGSLVWNAAPDGIWKMKIAGSLDGIDDVAIRLLVAS